MRPAHLLPFLLLAAACVGDAATTTGNDASTNDASTNDAGATDATSDTTGTDGGGGDATADAPKICDPDSAWGAPVEVTELTDGVLDTEGARLSSDQLTVFMSRTNGTDGTIMIAKRATTAAPFGTVSGLKGIGTGADHYPTLSPDETSLVFSRQRAITPFDDDLVISTKVAGAFGTPAGLSGLAKVKFNERQPSYASDEAIWLTTFVSFDGGPAVSRVNRSPKVTVSSYGLLESIDLQTLPTKSDSHPVLSSDGLRLYFASDRGATTDTNVWVAKRANTSAVFGPPTAVAELNAAIKNDAPTWLSADNCTIYLERKEATLRIFRATR